MTISDACMVAVVEDGDKTYNVYLVPDGPGLRWFDSEGNPAIGGGAGVKPPFFATVFEASAAIGGSVDEDTNGQGLAHFFRREYGGAR